MLEYYQITGLIAAWTLLGNRIGGDTHRQPVVNAFFTIKGVLANKLVYTICCASAIRADVLRVKQSDRHSTSLRHAITLLVMGLDLLPQMAA